MKIIKEKRGGIRLIKLNIVHNKKTNMPLNKDKNNTTITNY